MPLRPLPFREVKRKLEAAGFIEVSRKGSHVKFAKEAAEGTYTAIVPHHRVFRIIVKFQLARSAASCDRPELILMSSRNCRLP
jgi:predicted RNA binding protein YcfA (HicA-like mRNA interferase family)